MNKSNRRVVFQESIYDLLDEDLQRLTQKITLETYTFYRIEKDFISKLFEPKDEKLEFNEESDSTLPKLLPSQKNGIYSRFMSWMREKYPEEYLTNPQEGITPDSVFICLIPDTYSTNLIDLRPQEEEKIKKSTSGHGTFSVSISAVNPDYDAKIVQYFNDYAPLEGGFYSSRGSETKATPKRLRIYEVVTKSELLLYPSGEMFVQLNYSTLSKLTKFPRHKEDTYAFYPDHLYEDERSYLNTTQYSQKYGSPIVKVVRENLKSILEVICFPFTSEKLVRHPTRVFNSRIIFPGMILEGKPRKLYEDEPFYELSPYADDEPNIVFETQFSYEDIKTVIADLNKHCRDFFS